MRVKSAHVAHHAMIATIRIPNANGRGPRTPSRSARGETSRTERADPPGTSRGEARTRRPRRANSRLRRFRLARSRRRPTRSRAPAVRNTAPQRYPSKVVFPRHQRIASAQNIETVPAGFEPARERTETRTTSRVRTSIFDASRRSSSMLSAERCATHATHARIRFVFFVIVVGSRRDEGTQRCATIAASNAAAVGTPCESTTCATAKRAARLRLLVGFESVASTRRSVAIAAATTS